MRLRIIRDVADIIAKSLVAGFCGFFIYEKILDDQKEKNDEEQEKAKIGFLSPEKRIKSTSKDC